MIAEIHTLPPIRTGLEDPTIVTPGGTPQTAKEWYYFWRDSQDKINTLTHLVTWGTSSDRPDPTTAPDGALYVEDDRNGIIYQNQGGEWHYIAGTMYGTISPDQRPSGLGANDAGFEFRSADTNPLLGGHTWIWSGTAWIEVTPNRYGSHANRLLQPLANTWNGMIWVENDRNGVIYQNQSGVWHYLAGVMWGTISPDQRPTDLGANDAGFKFRSTDSNPLLGGHEWVWSGSAWIETTANRYGTHAARLALSLANTWNGMLWIETDRGNVIYQQQSGAWAYAAGIMDGTFSPDTRPTDLGTNDTGFRFEATDTLQTFRWSGSAWVDVTPRNSLLYSLVSTVTNLTTSPIVVPGLALTLTRAGVYAVSAVVDFAFFAGDGTLIGQLVVNGTADPTSIIFTSSATGRATVGEVYSVTATAGTVVTVQVWKTSGTAGSNSQKVNLSAMWVSPS